MLPGLRHRRPVSLVDEVLDPYLASLVPPALNIKGGQPLSGLPATFRVSVRFGLMRDGGRDRSGYVMLGGSEEEE